MKAIGMIKTVTEKHAWFVIIIALIAYFSTGIHQINSSEEGIVIQFGKIVRHEKPGINYHLPRPFESVIKVSTKSLRSIDIGFRKSNTQQETISYFGEDDLIARNAYIYNYRNYSSTASEIQKESLMMTSDNNFADVQASIQYRVSNPEAYAFKIVLVDDVLKCIGESFIRECVAEKTIDEVLTTSRDEIASEASVKIQTLVSELQLGITIVNVKLLEVKPPEAVTAAFDDVNSALQDKEKKLNMAIQYYNDVVSKSQGEASKTISEAEAYSRIQILSAEGETERFISVLNSYEKAPEITKKRMYLSTMEKILSGSDKIILPDSGEFNMTGFSETFWGAIQQ